MTHDALEEKVRKAFGVKIPFAAREKYAVFVREKRTEFTFRYEWIKDGRFYNWVQANLDVMDIMDGAETFGVFLCHPDGTPLNDYA